jgi:hypothetical protein
MISRIFGTTIWSRLRLSGPRICWRATQVLTGCLLCSSFFSNKLTKSFSSPLGSLLERGLFEPEQGEGQMWGQRNSKYAAAIGTQLLVKIHVLDNKIGRVDRQQNHPVDRLDECIDFVGEATDHVGKVVNELNSCIDVQDVQIQQLANMVNDLIRKVEGQAKVIKGFTLGARGDVLTQYIASTLLVLGQ